MTENMGRAALKRKLDQTTRRMKAAENPVTKDRLTELVRELERLFEIAAEREDPQKNDLPER